MARARSPNRDKAKIMYLESNGEKKLKDIAEELGLKDSQIRKWKSQDKWDQESKGALPKAKGNVTNKKKHNNVIEKESLKQDAEALIENDELTDKQKLFCIYYVKCFNIAKAALKAGYSKSYAYSRGYELLGNVGIKNEIQRLKANKFKGAFLEKEDLLQKYIDIAFADITDYMEFGQKEVEAQDSEGRPILDSKGNQVTYTVDYAHFLNSEEVDGTLISEVSKGKDGAKIKLQDKMKALDFLAKHIGLLSLEAKQKLELEKEKVKKIKADIDKVKDGDKDKPIEILIKRKGEGK
jgi:phage terminase small subunit